MVKENNKLTIERTDLREDKFAKNKIILKQEIEKRGLIINESYGLFWDIKQKGWFKPKKAEFSFLTKEDNLIKVKTTSKYLSLIEDICKKSKTYFIYKIEVVEELD